MSEYKYDVAISFAEEDRETAWLITRSLQAKGLKVFYYKDEQAENLGNDLFNITLKRYYVEAQLALVLISEHYTKKKWTIKEWEVIQAAQKERNRNYIIPIRLDHTELVGLSGNNLHKLWDNDADHVADMTFQHINTINKELLQSKDTHTPETKKSPTINVETVGTVIGTVDTIKAKYFAGNNINNNK